MNVPKKKGVVAPAVGDSGEARTAGTAPVDAAINESKITLDNLTLARKEGFRALAESPGLNQPRTLTMDELNALDDRQRRDYNRQRQVWHANFRTIKTTQLNELLDDIRVIVGSNKQHNDKVKGAIGIEAPSGVGKTSAVLDYATEFHREVIAEYGRFTEEGHERWPVCRVGLTGNTGIRDFMRGILKYYNQPGTKYGSAAEFGDRALDCVMSCQTKLLIVDEVHFLKRATVVEISNQFKYVSNEFGLTIIFIGIDLKGLGLYSDGSRANSVLGQSGWRITPLTLRSFDVDTPDHRDEWRRILLAFEQRIVLANKHRGMLLQHKDLLFERTSGRLGPLTTLLNRACYLAIHTGTECLNDSLLRRVRMEAAADAEREAMREKVARAARSPSGKAC